MSLQLATKGRLHGALSNATRGVLYVFGEVVLSVISDLIFRRATVTKVFGRALVQKVYRRTDV